MKKLTYVLGLLFVCSMAMTTYATTAVVDKDSNITIVDNNNDEKPCPAGCTCEKCEKAKADAKAEGKTAKTDCDKAAKADCNKAEKKSCCGSKADAKADTKEKTTPPAKK